MSLIAEYAIFLAKTITIVLAIILLLSAILNAAQKNKKSEKGTFRLKKINDDLQEKTDKLNSEILNKKNWKKYKKQQKKLAKGDLKNLPKLFVINFIGDMKASMVNGLREEVTGILLIAKPNDQVVVRLESPGGLVNAYGLAASQLQRIRDAKIKLTVCIDKVAASGGYLMACVADEIIAAPFSIIGSIGVVAQLPNFHRFLRKKDIDFEQITAGQYKRTLTMFGENTAEGREKVQEEINEVHELFKQFIIQHRPYIDLEKVATGEYWFATQAKKLQLIDHIQTSDDYLLNLRKQFDIFNISYSIKQPWNKRISQGVSKLFIESSTLYY